MNAGQYSSENEKSLTQENEHVQCAAASVGVDPVDDADEATVQAFTETLARIAHAVAARNIRQDQQERTDQ